MISLEQVDCVGVVKSAHGRVSRKYNDERLAGACTRGSRCPPPWGDKARKWSHAQAYGHVTRPAARSKALP